MIFLIHSNEANNVGIALQTILDFSVKSIQDKIIKYIVFIPNERHINIVNTYNFMDFIDCDELTFNDEFIDIEIDNKRIIYNRRTKSCEIIF